jgi:hypothetical protein
VTITAIDASDNSAAATTIVVSGNALPGTEPDPPTPPRVPSRPSRLVRQEEPR